MRTRRALILCAVMAIAVSLSGAGIVELQHLHPRSQSESGYAATFESGDAGKLVWVDAEDGGFALHFAGNARATDGEGAMIVLSGTGEEGADSLSIFIRLRIEEPKLATLARRTRGTEEIGYMLYLLDSGYVGFRLADDTTSGVLRSSRAIRPEDGWVDISLQWDGRIESGPNAILNVGGTVERGRIPLAAIPALDGDLTIGGLQRSRDGGKPTGQYFAGWMSDFSLGLLPDGELASELSARSGHIHMPPIFSDRMVLQRDAAVPVWGWAESGSRVTVEIAGQSRDAVANASGRWQVTLDPVPAGGPHEMIVRSGVTLTFSDILFGEVWLCGGQSNMEWTVRNTDEYDEELEIVRNASFPIRQFKFDRILRAHPDRDGVSAAGWVEVDTNQLSHFTAVGYHFVRRLHEELDVPVGLINSTWGGSQIAPWIPMSALEADERLSGYADWVRGAHENNRLGKAIAVAETGEWLARAESVVSHGGIAPNPPRWPSHPIHENRQTPTGMYNAMVAPAAGYGIRGFLFYQGESNRHDRDFYAVLMDNLISGWRAAWRDETLPFYFVQLAPFRYADNPGSLPYVQDAQRRVAATVPGTAMATISDFADLGDIHPRRKREVGRRLAHFALAAQHGVEGLPLNGPLPRDGVVEGGTVRVRFATSSGLKTRDGAAPDLFEIRDVEGGWHVVEATIEKDDVLLTLSEAILEPVEVRFAWNDTAIPTLISGDGLPASPFRVAVGKTP